MAAYRRVDDLRSPGGLTACTTLGIEYEKPLPLPLLRTLITTKASHISNAGWTDDEKTGGGVDNAGVIE